MSTDLNWIANYIWGIADDVLRDLYVRGKYRDVILPMTVLRRLDAVLEDTKRAVLDMKATLDDANVVEQDSALRQAAGQAFYNVTSEETNALNNAMDQTEREIKLLHEYRTRLLAGVVSGKLDVRDAAAALPEVDRTQSNEDMDSSLDSGVGIGLEICGTISKEEEA